MTRLTYRELADRCRRLAGALQSAGVGVGDRVAVLVANGHRYLECYFALPGMGAVMVPLNNRLARPELSYILEDGGVHTLLVDDAYAEAGRAFPLCSPKTTSRACSTPAEPPAPQPGRQRDAHGARVPVHE
jgi:acyl-CoA synthetase (AMP-forming)/AMP-acid ligase II